MLTTLPVDFSSLVVSGTKITMQQPRIAGFTSDSRPYELTAQAAAQDVTNPDMIELHGIHGKSEMPDKAVFDMTADGGVYDSKADIVTLRAEHHRQIRRADTRSISAEAVVDVHGSNMVSEKRSKSGCSRDHQCQTAWKWPSREMKFALVAEWTMVMSSGSRVMHLDGKWGFRDSAQDQSCSRAGLGPAGAR